MRGCARRVRRPRPEDRRRRLGARPVRASPLNHRTAVAGGVLADDCGRCWPTSSPAAGRKRARRRSRCATTRCARRTSASPTCRAIPGRRATSATCRRWPGCACTTSMKVRRRARHLAVPARQSGLELPVPQDDPGVPGGRRSRGGAGPARLRQERQAEEGAAHRFELAPAGAAGIRRAAGPCATSCWWCRTGAACSA
jgi:hypothetical protein